MAMSKADRCECFKCFIKWDVCQGCMYMVLDMKKRKGFYKLFLYEMVPRNEAG